MSSSKYRREVRKLADQYDRDVEIRKSGHLALVCRHGGRATVFTSASSSDHRTIKNLIKQLRQHDEARNLSEAPG